MKVRRRKSGTRKDHLERNKSASPAGKRHETRLSSSFCWNGTPVVQKEEEIRPKIQAKRQDSEKKTHATPAPILLIHTHTSIPPSHTLTHCLSLTPSSHERESRSDHHPILSHPHSQESRQTATLSLIEDRVFVSLPQTNAGPFT